MIAYYYYPIALALIFFGVGLFFYERRKGKQKVRQRFAMDKILPILFILAGCSVVVGMIAFSPSPSARQTLINGSLHSPVADIDEINIKPYPVPDHTSLVAASIPIRDRAAITRIADLLDHAVSFSPNHPVERWSVSITIKTKTSEYSFIVTQTSDTTNGTLIYVKSGLTEGWTIGTFRSDQLGSELERLTQGR